MKFYYEAFTTKGEPRRGDVEAQSESHAAGIIRNEMGLIAREISSTEFEPKFDHRAVAGSEAKPYVPDADGVVEEDGMRLNPTPEEAPADKAPVRAPEPTWQDDLADDLTKCSQVARQMVTWEKNYKKAAAEAAGNATDLPASDPAMGGVSWKIWEKRREEFIFSLMQKALERACLGD